MHEVQTIILQDMTYLTLINHSTSLIDKRLCEGSPQTVCGPVPLQLYDVTSAIWYSTQENGGCRKGVVYQVTNCMTRSGLKS